MYTPSKMHSSKVIFFTSLVINILVLDWIVITKLINKTYLISESETENSYNIALTPTISPTVIPSVTPSVSNQVETKTLVYREVYIPIGSSSTKSSSWEGLSGVEVNIDTSKYGYIKESYFQASLRIPTANGEVYAKLYNETDKHDVWFSEVKSQGAAGTIKEAKISLNDGAKLYRVYLKSTLEAEALLEFSRIKLIIVE